LYSVPLQRVRLPFIKITIYGIFSAANFSRYANSLLFLIVMKIIRCLTILPVVSLLFAASSFAQDITLGGQEYSISLDEVGSTLPTALLDSQPWYGNVTLADDAATLFAGVSPGTLLINGSGIGGPFFVTDALSSSVPSLNDVSFYTPGGPAINTGILVTSPNYYAVATLVSTTVPDAQSTFPIVLGVSLLLYVLRRSLSPQPAAS
jgi:hypothetical protein